MKVFGRAILLSALLLTLFCAVSLADDGNAAYKVEDTLLSDLTHNCPNTGIMLPDSFSPYQTTYLLTVADWVSRPTFTPTASSAGITMPPAATSAAVTRPEKCPPPR